MPLTKTLTDAHGPTHPRSQLRIYVICKTDSEEPENKSEIHFLSAGWSESISHRW